MTARPLHDRRILCVEDEYFLALELQRELTARGAAVIGPVPSVEQALARIAAEESIDAAVVDVNLGGDMSFPVADALLARGIPFVFTTGYVNGNLDTRYPHIVRCDKPLVFQHLQQTLTAMFRT